MDWYYERDGAPAGPVTEAELRQLSESGEITESTQIARAGGSNWMPFWRLDDPSGAAEVCSQCGRQTRSDQTIQYSGLKVCADCKPVFLQRVREGVDVSSAGQYGGFWIRFLARFVDGILMSIVNTILYIPLFVFAMPDLETLESTGEPSGAFMAMTCGIYLLQFALAATYEIWFTKRFAATPGKMICRLRVVRSDGSDLSWGRATGRYFGNLLSSFTMGIGYIMAAFDDQKRTLHDHLCDTRVVKST